MKKTIILAVLLPFGVLSAYLFVELFSREGSFTLNNGEVAVITKNGKVDRILNKPGKHWSTPFLEKRYSYSKDIHGSKTEKVNILSYDRYPINIEYQFNWKIDDPQKFYYSYGSSYPYEMEPVMLAYTTFIERQLTNMLANYRAAALAPHTGFSRHIESEIQRMLQEYTPTAKKRSDSKGDGVYVEKIDISFSY